MLHVRGVSCSICCAYPAVHNTGRTGCAGCTNMHSSIPRTRPRHRLDGPSHHGKSAASVLPVGPSPSQQIIAPTTEKCMADISIQLQRRAGRSPKSRPQEPTAHLPTLSTLPTKLLPAIGCVTRWLALFCAYKAPKQALSCLSRRPICREAREGSRHALLTQL